MRHPFTLPHPRTDGEDIRDILTCGTPAATGSAGNGHQPEPRHVPAASGPEERCTEGYCTLEVTATFSNVTAPAGTVFARTTPLVNGETHSETISISLIRTLRV